MMADLESNAFLRQRLAALFPLAGWLSEETEDDQGRLGAEWTWIVDPLDGTKEFLQRIPRLAISVGLVRHEAVVMVGIFGPVAGEGGAGEVNGAVTSWGFDAPATGTALVADATACVSRTEIEDGSITPSLGCVREARPFGSVAYTT